MSHRYRESALDWANDWLKASLKDHIENDRTWAQAEAFDAWWPQPYFPPAADLAEGSPFMHEAFVSCALGQPIPCRYSASRESEYHRFKTLVVELFDESHHSRLPKRKQYFTTLSSEIDDVPLKTPLAIELGLFDRSGVTNECDTAIKKLALSTER